MRITKLSGFVTPQGTKGKAHLYCFAYKKRLHSLYMRYISFLSFYMSRENKIFFPSVSICMHEYNKKSRVPHNCVYTFIYVTTQYITSVNAECILQYKYNVYIVVFLSWTTELNENRRMENINKSAVPLNNFFLHFFCNLPFCTAISMTFLAFRKKFCEIFLEAWQNTEVNWISR